jgi:hypothetical protein
MVPKLTLNNSIHGAALLAVTAVNALGHVDIVTGRPAASVHTLFRLNSDSLGRTDGLAELAGNAAFLAGGIATQGVLTAETGRDGTLLEGVEDGVPVARKDIRLGHLRPVGVESLGCPCRQPGGLTVGGSTAPTRHTCRGRARP